VVVGVVEVVLVNGGPVGGRDADAEFLESAIVEEGIEVLGGEAGGRQDQEPGENAPGHGRLLVWAVVSLG
jgi:hypothetical protein